MVNFNKLKRKIGFAEVLEHYGLLDRLKQTKPGQYRGVCPIHEGAKTKSSFSVSTVLNGFKCWSCGEEGSILDFVMAMEGLEGDKKKKTSSSWSVVGSVV